jgi:hypothetical protein
MHQNLDVLGRPTQRKMRRESLWHLLNSPKESTRRAAQELSLPRTSLRRLMHKLNFKPYRPKLLHGLLEVDPDRRLQFCEIVRNQISDERDLIHKIIWTDEARFKLSGHVNRYNCVYWADENPHLTIRSQLTLWRRNFLLNFSTPCI